MVRYLAFGAISVLTVDLTETKHSLIQSSLAITLEDWSDHDYYGPVYVGQTYTEYIVIYDTMTK